MIVVQYIRSLLFNAQMYLALAVIAVGGLPYALIGGRSAAIKVCQAYCHWVRFTARWMVGLNSEIRGPVPQGDVLIASKHQSFFDILMIYSAVPRGKFIMKKELVWTPFVGWYAYLIGCVPVDRGKDRNTGWEIEGVPATLLAEFSRRTTGTRDGVEGIEQVKNRLIAEYVAEHAHLSFAATI